MSSLVLLQQKCCLLPRWSEVRSLCQGVAVDDPPLMCTLAARQKQPAKIECLTLAEPNSSCFQAPPSTTRCTPHPLRQTKYPSIPKRKRLCVACLGTHIEQRGSVKTEELSRTGLPLPTFDDFQSSAAEKGVVLELSTLGPFFWIEAKAAAEGFGVPPGKLLGKVDGFVLPWLGGNILHLDSMRVAKIESEKVRSIFGLAVILGGAMLRHGYDRGCKRAELLAINDTDEYHKKLVNYYGRLGFKAVHEVTGGLGDIPHMLVWGGLGTRMDADIDKILRKWSKRFVKGDRTR